MLCIDRNLIYVTCINFLEFSIIQAISKVFLTVQPQKSPFFFDNILITEELISPYGIISSMQLAFFVQQLRVLFFNYIGFLGNFSVQAADFPFKAFFSQGGFIKVLLQGFLFRD